MKPYIAVFVGAVLAPLLFGAGKVNQSALDISLIQLVASPEKSTGKVVRTIGFLHVEFEGNAIYVHREDYEKRLSKNSLWIDASPEMMTEMKKMSDHYVLIEGVFAPGDRGHMDMNSGAIVKITRAEIWAD